MVIYETILALKHSHQALEVVNLLQMPLKIYWNHQGKFYCTLVVTYEAILVWKHLHQTSEVINLLQMPRKIHWNHQGKFYCTLVVTYEAILSLSTCIKLWK